MHSSLCRSSSSRRHMPAWAPVLVVSFAALAFLTSCKGAPDMSTPKKTATAFATAMMAGDMDTIHQVCVGSDADFANIKNMADVTQAMKKFQDAMIAKFPDHGKDFKERTKGFRTDYENATEKITGDTATVDDLDLKKDGSNWKVDLSKMGTSPFTGDTKGMVDGINQTTKEVNDGKFKTADEAQYAMGKAMAKGRQGRP